MDIYIKNGCIVVQNSGGSADKWDYVHTYRYQNNNWYLIVGRMAGESLLFLMRYSTLRILNHQ